MNTAIKPRVPGGHQTSGATRTSWVTRRSYLDVCSFSNAGRSDGVIYKVAAFDRVTVVVRGAS